MSYIEDYVHFEAQLANYYFDNGEYKWKTQILPLHPCDEQDKFFEPHSQNEETF